MGQLISEEEFKKFRKIVREEVREAIRDFLKSFRDAAQEEFKKTGGSDVDD